MVMCSAAVRSLPVASEHCPHTVRSALAGGVSPGVTGSPQAVTVE